MKETNDNKSIQMKKISKTYSELANILEGIEQSIKWLDEQIIERDKYIQENELTENSWEWRDQLDNFARREALLDIIDYLSKFKWLR